MPVYRPAVCNKTLIAMRFSRIFAGLNSETSLAEYHFNFMPYYSSVFNSNMDYMHNESSIRDCRNRETGDC